MPKEQPEAGHEGFSGVRVAWYFMCLILHFTFAPIVEFRFTTEGSVLLKEKTFAVQEQPEAGYERFSGIGMSCYLLCFIMRFFRSPI